MQQTDTPVWKNFMALASARPDCLVSSSGADYKTWSRADQNCNVFVRSATRQQLASHKPAATLRKIFFWFKQIIPLLYGQNTVCLIETNSLFGDFCLIQTNILYKTCKLFVWVIVRLTKFVWYKQIFCFKVLEFLFRFFFGFHICLI